MVAVPGVPAAHLPGGGEGQPHVGSAVDWVQAWPD